MTGGLADRAKHKRSSEKLRPLQNSFSPNSQNPNTGFRLFSPPITPNFTQIPP
nr:MAG TPA: hypothetical protein [Caudoviricetes sp.]